MAYSSYVSRQLSANKIKHEPVYMNPSASLDDSRSMDTSSGPQSSDVNLVQMDLNQLKSIVENVKRTDATSTPLPALSGTFGPSTASSGQRPSVSEAVPTAVVVTVDSLPKSIDGLIKELELTCEQESHNKCMLKEHEDKIAGLERELRVYYEKVKILQHLKKSKTTLIDNLATYSTKRVLISNQLKKICGAEAKSAVNERNIEKTSNHVPPPKRPLPSATASSSAKKVAKLDHVPAKPAGANDSKAPAATFGVKSSRPVMRARKNITKTRVVVKRVSNSNKAGDAGKSADDASLTGKEDADHGELVSTLNESGDLAGGVEPSKRVRTPSESSTSTVGFEEEDVNAPISPEDENEGSDLSDSDVFAELIKCKQEPNPDPTPGEAGQQDVKPKLEDLIKKVKTEKLDKESEKLEAGKPSADKNPLTRCSLCEKSFEKETELKQHIREEHPPPSIFQ